MKVKVVTLKDIIKYLAKTVLTLAIVAILANFFYVKKGIKNYIKFDATKFIYVMNSQIIILKADSKNNNKENKEYIANTINQELCMLKTVQTSKINGIANQQIANSNSQNMEDSNTNSNDNSISQTAETQGNTGANEQENANNEEKTQIQEAPSNVNVKVQPTNIPDKTTYTVFGVNIRNESDYNIQEEIKDLNVNINKKNVIIFHTHTCESYTQTEQNTYTPSGSYRTTDLNYTVSRVGDELEKYLNSYGYNVIHNKTYHDYPSYNGSYNRSLVTVQKLLQENENTDVVIDLHRDAIGDNTYAPKVKIGDEYCSRIMFVMGTDGGGLKDDNWRENVKFAIKLVQKGNELYPRTV